MNNKKIDICNHYFSEPIYVPEKRNRIKPDKNGNTIIYADYREQEFYNPIQYEEYVQSLWKRKCNLCGYEQHTQYYSNNKPNFDKAVFEEKIINALKTPVNPKITKRHRKKLRKRKNKYYQLHSGHTVYKKKGASTTFSLNTITNEWEIE